MDLDPDFARKNHIKDRDEKLAAIATYLARVNGHQFKYLPVRWQLRYRRAAVEALDVLLGATAGEIDD